MIEEKLRDSAVRCMYKLGDAGSRFEVLVVGPKQIKLQADNVVIRLAYDTHDRNIYGVYWSPAIEVKHESDPASRFDLVNEAKSPIMLLYKRGIDVTRFPNIDDPQNIDEWMGTFFDALRDHAQDLLKGEAEGLGRG